MSSTQNLVETILSKPQAKLIMAQVSDELSKEEGKRQEFYEWVDENMKAEFINGEIILHSPVSLEHTIVTKNLLGLLDNYVFIHNCGYVGVEKVMTKFTRNDYEPDLCYFDKAQSKQFKEGQNLFPIPKMIVEIWSKSTKKLDQTTKFNDYQNHGIEEYWMVDPKKKVVEQYQLSKGKYELILKSGDGKIHSKAIKGFSIPIKAIFEKKLQLDTLRKILAGK